MSIKHSDTSDRKVINKHARKLLEDVSFQTITFTIYNISNRNSNLKFKRVSDL